MIGAAAHYSRTEPVKVAARSRGVRLPLDLPKTVGSHEFIGAAPHAHSAISQLVGPDMLFEIFGGVQRGPCL